MANSENDLVAEFGAFLRQLYRRIVTETDYRPIYFKKMLANYGGLGTARILLYPARPASGLTTLWKKGRLDLSVEAAVLQPRWSELFTEEERATARKRLHDLGYKA